MLAAGRAHPGRVARCFAGFLSQIKGRRGRPEGGGTSLPFAPPMHYDFLSAFILLLLVLDPFGALPVFIHVMGWVPAERRRLVALRESAIAFAILLAFMFSGRGFLRLMNLSERS